MSLIGYASDPFFHLEAMPSDLLGRNGFPSSVLNLFMGFVPPFVIIFIMSIPIDGHRPTALLVHFIASLAFPPHLVILVPPLHGIGISHLPSLPSLTRICVSYLVAADVGVELMG
jgi:hypothetical protein